VFSAAHWNLEIKDKKSKAIFEKQLHETQNHINKVKAVVYLGSLLVYLLCCIFIPLSSQSVAEDKTFITLTNIGICITLLYQIINAAFLQKNVENSGKAMAISSVLAAFTYI